MTLSSKQVEALQFVLKGLMRRYRERVPDVAHIVSEMVKQGVVDSEEAIVNDHIAFRTLGVPYLGIQSLEKIFLAYGYERRDAYYFEGKKVDAYWYSPPTDIPNLPRIFISECRVPAFSEQVQKIVRSYTTDIHEDPVASLDLMDGSQVDDFLHRSLWRSPSWDDYSTVLDESEYVSWVLNNRYYLNHYTISIHALKEGYNKIEAYNGFLESIGITLNDAGGVIKRSSDGKLLQSSSVSNQVRVPFPCEDGTTESHLVSGSYVEFAQRIDGRDGFDQGNADKIFESTYTDQVKRS